MGKPHHTLLFFYLIIFVLISFIHSNNNGNNHSSTTQNISTKAKEKRKALITIFPGGKSHHFVIKELLDYVIKREKDYEYEFHIIVHNADKRAWKNTNYTIFSFGDETTFSTMFEEAIQQATDDPVFGYSKFNQAMINMSEEFLKLDKEIKLVERLKRENYDLLITDISNFINKMLYTYLKPRLTMILSPPCLTNLLYELFEFNPSYVPSIGTPFDEVMTFSERFRNVIFFYGTKLFYSVFMYKQSKIWHEYGYTEVPTNVFNHKSFVMSQCTDGFSFAQSLPPNFVNLGGVTYKDAQPITDPKIIQFLDKHEKNIYVSQGTLVKVLDIVEIVKLVNHYPQYGFILSLKRELTHNVQFPSNTLVMHWAPQNDLLGDSRVHGFISHGGINSILESIYHLKPMIAIGLSIDQYNTAAVVKSRKVGVSISTRADLNAANLIEKLQEILTNPTYIEHCKVISKRLKGQKPREKFNYWLNYIFEYGYDHLLIKAYTENYEFQCANLDVYACYLLILYFFYWLFKKILTAIFCSCKTKKKCDSKSKKLIKEYELKDKKDK